MVNAGGQGARMGPGPIKPLREVLGVPLVERCVTRLLAQGLERVVVVIPTHAEALASWWAAWCARVGPRWAAAVTLHRERTPRGTAGGLEAARGLGVDAVLVYADNLTDLDVPAMLRAHRRARADITLAAHTQAVTLPWGRVRRRGGALLGYDEKPSLPVEIASGAYVFSPACVESLPPEARVDVPALIEARRSSGARVRVWTHASAWLDVNDLDALKRAAHLARSTLSLECVVRTPADTVQVVGALLVRGDAVLLERRSPRAALTPGVWDTPGGKLELGEAPAAALQRELREELDLCAAHTQPLGVFDEPDARGVWVRQHAFALRVDLARQIRGLEGQTLEWHPLVSLPEPLAPAVRRSIARWQQMT